MVIAQQADHVETVKARHAQVDQHHGGAHLDGEFDRAFGAGVVAQRDAGTPFETMGDEILGEGFVVDQ